MDQERRRFLKNLAAVCAGGVARSLGVGVTAAVATTAATETAARAAGATVAAQAVGAYGSGVRPQVFEVIVRQAMAGAPWREICKGPMRVNGITEEQVEREVERRRGLVHVDVKTCQCVKCVEKRVEQRQKVLDSIPHSEKAPCACNNCRAAVTNIMLSLRKEIEG